ncbi:MAG: hypothetical protein AVDCRST_MAG15-3318, partial [uncultured Rubellimicrobium sp.]
VSRQIGPRCGEGCHPKARAARHGFPHLGKSCRDRDIHETL